MGRIALLTASYVGASAANAICANNIVDALCSAGHKVDVICREDKPVTDEITENIHIVTCNVVSKKKLGVLHKAKTAFNIAFGLATRNMNGELIQAYYKCLCKLNEQEKIDAVIGIYFPLESAEALRLFTKSHPEVKTILYELDSIGDGIGTKNAILKKACDRMYVCWLNKVYNAVDAVFVMQTHKEYWMRVFGDKYGEKMRLADIPVLVEKKLPMVAPNEDAPVSFIYAGLIEKAYRSPEYLLACLTELKKTMDFKFSFYSKGDCEDMIARVSDKIGGITQNGYVPQDELDKAIATTDFLVSIGNSVSRSLPSKIITYLAYGKPIIHFSSQSDDVCNEYLMKYPLALVIDQSMPILETCKKIMDFLTSAKDEKVDFEQIKDIFYLHLPSSSASIIHDVIDKGTNREGDIQ